MEGKYIGSNLIRGVDGKRYHFELSEIVNLNGKNTSQIIGYKMDFEIDGDRAYSIYITNPSHIIAMQEQSPKPSATQATAIPNNQQIPPPQAPKENLSKYPEGIIKGKENKKDLRIHSMI